MYLKFKRMMAVLQNDGKRNGSKSICFGLHPTEPIIGYVNISGHTHQFPENIGSQNDRLLNIKALGWGLLVQFPPFRDFAQFLQNYQSIGYFSNITFIFNRCHLSLAATCQIWMWFKWYSWYIFYMRNASDGIIYETSFRDPQPVLP